MNSTNKHELAVELIGTTFQDIIGASLSDFPDTPLTLEIFDKMEEYIDKFKNDTEKLKMSRAFCNHSTPLNWGIFFAPMKKNG